MQLISGPQRVFRKSLTSKPNLRNEDFSQGYPKNWENLHGKHGDDTNGEHFIRVFTPQLPVKNSQDPLYAVNFFVCCPFVILRFPFTGDA